MRRWAPLPPEERVSGEGSAALDNFVAHGWRRLVWIYEAIYQASWMQACAPRCQRIAEAVGEDLTDHRA